MYEKSSIDKLFCGNLDDASASKVNTSQLQSRVQSIYRALFIEETPYSYTTNKFVALLNMQ